MQPLVSMVATSYDDPTRIHTNQSSGEKQWILLEHVIF